MKMYYKYDKNPLFTLMNQLNKCGSDIQNAETRQSLQTKDLSL